MAVSVATEAGGSSRSRVLLQRWVASRSRVSLSSLCPTHFPCPDCRLVSGYKDHVFCYMCDGGVKDWEDDDDPWVEHQRWYKNCPHLQLSQTRPTEAQSVLDRPKETLAQWNPSVPPPQEREALRGPEERGGQSGGGGSGDDCVVCFDGEKMVLFSPCSHLVCCPGCADKLTCCPICRQLIRDKIHVFKC